MGGSVNLRGTSSNHAPIKTLHKLFIRVFFITRSSKKSPPDEYKGSANLFRLMIAEKTPAGLRTCSQVP